MSGSPDAPASTSGPSAPARSAKRSAKSKSAAQTAQHGVGTGTNDVDIDAVLAELDLQDANAATAGGPAGAAGASSSDADVLSVTRKRLDAQEEMRGIFGTSVAALERQVERDDAEQQGGAAAVRVPGRRARGRHRAVAVGSVGNLTLAQGVGRPYDGSLDMERAAAAPADAAGTATFVYVGSGSYRMASMHYEQAQASHDPNNIMMVLQQYPFHVESLLAMVDLHLATDQVCIVCSSSA